MRSAPRFSGASARMPVVAGQMIRAILPPPWCRKGKTNRRRPGNESSETTPYLAAATDGVQSE